MDTRILGPCAPVRETNLATLATSLHTTDMDVPGRNVGRTSDVDALASLGSDIPEVQLAQYIEAVRLLRTHLICNPPIKRYTKAPGRGANAAAAGERSSAHAEQQNPYQNDWFLHAQFACAEAHAPSPTERARSSFPPDIEKAIAFTLDLGPEKLAGWRERQLNVFHKAETLLVGINKLLSRTGRPPNVTRVAGTIQLGTLACILDAIGSPDASLPRRFQRGFQLNGDIEDSGVFRPVQPPEPFAHAARRAELRAGSWEAWSSLEREVRRDAFSTDEATRKELCAKTRDQSDLFRMSEPLTMKQLCIALWDSPNPPADEHGDYLCPLASMRFGTWQKGKLRPIENCRKSGVNEELRLLETICLPTVDWPGLVASRIWHRAHITGTPMPELAVSTDDVQHGYNNCPAQEPQIFCMWDEQAKAPRWHLAFVCGFGNAASVLSFCRPMEAIARFNARMFGGFARAYIDDWLQPDYLAAGRSAQRCLAAVHKAIGIPLAACHHASCSECSDRPSPAAQGRQLPRCKRQRFRQTQEALGVVCDLSTARQGFVQYWPTADRCVNVLDALRQCETEGRITARVAERILGKLAFLTHSGVFGGVARGPTWPFYRRANHRSVDQFNTPDHSDKWHPRMATALRFLEAILAPDALPKRRICFDNVQLPHVVAYSDAEGAEFGIGLALFDPMQPRPPTDILAGTLAAGYFSSTTCPHWLLENLRAMHSRDDDQGLINCVELVGAISLLLTFEDIISDRHALLYQDNSTAFHCMISGSSKSMALAAIANIYHCVVAALNPNVWVELVSTHAMIADVPSRMRSTKGQAPRTELFLKLGLLERAAVFPTPIEWENPIGLYHSLRRRRLARLPSGHPS